MKSFLIILFFLLLQIAFVLAQETTIYVTPKGDDSFDGLTPGNSIKSLNRAFEIVASSNRTNLLSNNFKVMVADGVYPMSTPIILKSGSFPQKTMITVEGTGPGKALLTGAKSITGWKKYKKNIWMAFIPEAKNGNWKFSQLFVNGESRTLARFPNDGYYRVTGFPDGGEESDYHAGSKRFQFRPGDINPRWSNLDDVHVIVYHFWTDTHLQIQTIDTKTNIVTFKYGASKRFTDDFSGEGAKYIVENVFEGLDNPGEWYLNYQSGVLYYIPLQGEDLSKADVAAPVLPYFIKLEGNPLTGDFVENIHFKNIAFNYTDFNLPEGDANDTQASVTIPAAITLSGAKNCSFVDCDFSKLGTYAFEINAGCSELEFSYNKCLHNAAGGFKINGGTENDHPLLRTRNITISDNEIGYYGEKYPSAVGVLLMHAEGNYIGHNLIHHGGYTGISVGWNWGYERSISRDNIIEYNHIHHIGQGVLSDMGGIYTLGVSPGTVLRNNLIHDVEANKYGGWGIYNDEGSTHILVENNIVYNTKYAAYDIHYARELTVRNNIFALGRLEELNRTKGEPHISVYFENNIVYWNTIKDPFSADWKDQTYRFHVNPWSKEQPEKSSTFESDYNLYFNPTLPIDSVQWNGNSWNDWRKRGKDVHSLYADPLFMDAEHFNFQLKPESPAFQLGFKQIDMSTVGPRKNVK
jgi:hypothetical protein